MTVPKAHEVLKLTNPTRRWGIPKTHALYNSLAHRCWLSMHHRVRYDQDYKGYQVSPRWFDFLKFYSDLGPPPSADHSLDRIDNSKGYVPGNVRWATPTQQTRNRTNTIVITYDGIDRPLVELCNEMSVPYSTAVKRYQRGWSNYEIIHGRAK